MMNLLFVVFAIAIGIQIAYFLVIFAALLIKTKKNKQSQKPFITVVICAKNEANNLAAFLPFILEQNYRNTNFTNQFEVLVVNDFSTDNTADVLRHFQNSYSHLRVVDTDRSFLNFKGKKAALFTAQKHAKGAYLLMTDADCKPASNRWISEMISYLSEEKIVAGFGAYEHKKTFLNAFIQFETLHTFVQYAAFAKAGKPYMFVGRNVLYKKDLISSGDVPSSWKELSYGDDDLLLHGSQKQSLVIADAALSKTVSIAPYSWKSWLHQKQRHLSTGKYYRLSSKLLLGFYALSHHISWLLGIYFLIQNPANASIFLGRCLLFWLIWSVVALRLKEKSVILWIPIMDFLWLVYNIALSPYIFFRNKNKWKKEDTH